MCRRHKREDDLDTDTTFADMNVEGFKWYDPDKKSGRKRRKVDRKEYWAMVRGAFAAYLPAIVIIILVGLLMYCAAYLWLM